MTPRIPLTAAFLALHSPLALAAPQGGTGGPPFISEIRIEQPGADVDEYFELVGNPGGSLDQVTYLVVGDGDSGSGTVESALDLTGSSLDADGRFVCAVGPSVLGTTPDLVAALGFRHGGNVTHLLVLGFAGAVGDDLDVNDDGVLDNEPFFGVLDGVAIVAQPNSPTSTVYHYGGYAGVVSEVGPDFGFSPAHVFECSDGWRIGGYAAGAHDSPGAPNPCGASTAMFCIPNPNSVSASGSFITLESPSGGSVAANDSSLVVHDTPDFFGAFIMGGDRGTMVPAAFGGLLCLRNQVQRLGSPLMPSGNVAALPLDFTGMGPESAVMAGTTSYFQWFHRDTTFGGGGNFSLGLRVTWAN